MKIKLSDEQSVLLFQFLITSSLDVEILTSNFKDNVLSISESEFNEIFEKLPGHIMKIKDEQLGKIDFKDFRNLFIQFYPYSKSPYPLASYIDADYKNSSPNIFNYPDFDRKEETE